MDAPPLQACRWCALPLEECECARRFVWTQDLGFSLIRYLLISRAGTMLAEVRIETLLAAAREQTYCQWRWTVFQGEKRTGLTMSLEEAQQAVADVYAAHINGDRDRLDALAKL